MSSYSQFEQPLSDTEAELYVEGRPLDAPLAWYERLALWFCRR